MWLSGAQLCASIVPPAGVISGLPSASQSARVAEPTSNVESGQYPGTATVKTTAVRRPAGTSTGKAGVS
jgi:hypothetical protein